MKKQDTLNQVLEILKSHKVKNSQLIDDLTELLGPKTRVVTELYPPKMDESGGIIELYCIRIGEYLPVEDFSKSTKSKNGYSKESKIGIKIWNIYNKQIQDLKQSKMEIMSQILEGEITVEDAKGLNLEIDEKIANLEDLRKSPYGLEMYEANK